MCDRIDRTSVPAIWIDGVYAGGCNDGGLGGVVKLDQQGRLDELLKAAGAVSTASSRAAAMTRARSLFSERARRRYYVAA